MALIDILAIAAVVVAVVLWLTRKKTGIVIPGVGWSGGGPSVVSMSAAAWDFRYGTGISGHPSPAPGGGFEFDFPTAGDVDYLTTNVSINAKDRVTCHFEIDALSGAPAFKATDGGSPAAVGVMLEVRGDDMISEDGRWWARLERIALGVGIYGFEIDLTDLSQWSNVQGHVASDRPSQFHDAVANLGAVGLTFGATSFGHGVSVTGGTARLTLTEFSIQ